MDIQELRDLSVHELRERLALEKKELNMKVLNHKASMIDNPAEITQRRRNVARISTILREKSIEENDNN